MTNRYTLGASAVGFGVALDYLLMLVTLIIERHLVQSAGGQDLDGIGAASFVVSFLAKIVAFGTMVFIFYIRQTRSRTKLVTAAFTLMGTMLAIAVLQFAI